MIRKTRLVVAFVLGAGLAAAGVALAQTQTATGSAAAPGSAQAAPPPTQSTLRWVPETPDFKPWDPNSSQPTYSVTPPPGSSGIYLPAVVLGYTKSVAGCIVIGCDDGPQVGDSSGSTSSGSSSSGSAAPPPANPGLVSPH